MDSTFGANASAQVTDRLRVGGQMYDHNIGNLGEWHPALDWAFADYRWRPWFGARAVLAATAQGQNTNARLGFTF